MYLDYIFSENNSRDSSRKTLENLTSSMACNYYKKDNLIIARNENGKPYFENENNLYFNGSHSSNLFAVLMNDYSNVGIDAEKIKKRDFFEIAEEYFYEKEIKYLKSSLKLEIDFFTIWTIKESYIKMLGKTVFDIKKSKNSIEVDLEERLINNADNLFFASFMIDDSYIISICSEMRSEIELNIKDFNLNLIFAYPILPSINIDI